MQGLTTLEEHAATGVEDEDGNGPVQAGSQVDEQLLRPTDLTVSIVHDDHVLVGHVRSYWRGAGRIAPCARRVNRKLARGEASYEA